MSLNSQRCHAVSCTAEPVEGQKLLLCSGCRAACYCSQDCQNKAWKLHKLSCRELAGPVALKTVPSPDALLREFTNIYSWSFQKAAYSALRVQGGMEKFDYSKNLMLIDLVYRPECKGNPGLSFVVQSASLIPKEDINPDRSFLLQMAESALLTKKMALRGSESDFVDLLIVLFATKDDFMFNSQPVYRHSEGFEKFSAKINHDVWLGELQSSVNNGHVFMAQEDSTARLGRMNFNGSTWSWAALSDAQVKAMGLPTMPEIGIKREGFSLLF